MSAKARARDVAKEACVAADAAIMGACHGQRSFVPTSYTQPNAPPPCWPVPPALAVRRRSSIRPRAATVIIFLTFPAFFQVNPLCIIEHSYMKVGKSMRR